VILALLLWLASRTEWQPSAPLRLERRRAWGSIVTAASRMYFGHLKLFLGIGLLFLPLGVLITAVQYATFRVRGLNGLVESAGRTNAVVDSLAIGLGALFVVVGLSVVQSATAIAMRELDEGRAVTAFGAYRQALPQLVSLLSAVVLVVAAVTVVSFTAVGALLVAWLVVRWSLLAQVHVLENTSGLRRCGGARALSGGTGGASPAWCCS
jgi:hypothetical protein